MQRSRSRTQILAATADRILELEEQLRSVRGQLAGYGNTLMAIQRSILPRRLPEVPGLDLAVHSAELDHAGGDFYDVSPLGPESWAIVVADVSGHGLAAAAVLALTHALGHALQVQGTPPSPGAALALVNGALATRYLVNSGQFVTAFAGWYEAQTQVFKYASAGHPPPRLIRGNDVRRLDAVSGIPLGVDGETFYQEALVQLRPGDRLVLFTDGITEGINAAGELFGDPRLDEVLCSPTNGAAELVDRVLHAVQAFRAGLPPTDDETCLVAVVKPIGDRQDESEVVRC
jgi:sigma-B regulation protein RsbU (phosphoserine phosphatase)